MNARTLHADVVAITSRIWQTSAVLVRAGDEALLIDSPVLPDELALLPRLAEQTSFHVRGLLCTHGDWDHLLGRLAFPQLPLGCGDATAARLAAEPGVASRELRSFDQQHYLQRPRPLVVGALQELPVPGYCALGSDGRELELHQADGHTADGCAFLIPWARVLVCGDYLSPAEIPTFVPGGSLAAYQATLDRFEPLLDGVDYVVPGHGAPMAVEQAREILAQDRTYLAALAADAVRAALPSARNTSYQRRLHRENVLQLGDLAQNFDQ